MSIYSGVDSIAHAGLMNPADPLDRKTVSFSALLDKTHYRLLRDVGPDPVEQDISRGTMQTKAEPMLPSSKPTSVFFWAPTSQGVNTLTWQQTSTAWRGRTPPGC